MSIIFEYLSNKDLIKGQKVNLPVVEKLRRSSIISIAEEVTALSSAENIPRESSMFSHSASLSLGGAAFPCRNLSCRVDRLSQLSQFAAFYSDRVFINNILDGYVPHDEEHEHGSIDDMRLTFRDDLILLTYLRPLIESGLVVPVSPPEVPCVRCLARKSFGKDADKRLDQQHRKLISRLHSEIKIQIEKTKGGFKLLIEAPEELIEHGCVYHRTPTLPPALSKRLGLMKRLERGEIVRVPQSLVKASEEADVIAGEIFSNVVFDMALSQTLHTSFLTERTIHIDILNSLSNSPAIAARNDLLAKHLSAIVPFVEGIGAKELLTLRNREQDSFIVFRKRLTDMFHEATSSGSPLSERQASALYSDLVAPELAKLDKKISAARRHVLRQVSGKVGAWVGAISLGTYIGFLPHDIIQIAQALGLTKVAANIIEATTQLSAKDQHVRQEDFYFLWRVRQLSLKGDRHLTSGSS